MTARSEPAAPSEAAPHAKRRGWRRVRFWAILLLCLAIGLRLALAIAMPWILGAVAASLDLDCTYDRLDLSVLGGDIELWNLTLKPRGAEDRLVELEYARLDLAMSALFTGRLVVRRAEVDGLDVYLHRRADGTASFDGLLRARSDAGRTVTSAQQSQGGHPREIDLTCPVRVDAARLQHVFVHWRDETQSPAVDARVEIHVRLSHLGHPEREARCEVLAASRECLDTFRIEARGRSAARTLDAHWSVRLGGFRTPFLEPYLRRWGLDPAARQLDGALDGSVSVRASGPEGPGMSARLEIRDVRAAVDGAAFLSANTLLAEASSIQPEGAVVDRVHVKGVRVRAARLADGAPTFGGMVFRQPDGLKPGPVPVAESGGRGAGRGLAARRNIRDGPPELGFREALLEDLEVRFHDEAVSPAASLSVRMDRFEVHGPVDSPDAEGGASRIEALLEAPGVLERLTLRGDASLQGRRKTVRVEVDARGIRPEALGPYLDAANMSCDLENGHFRCGIELAFDLHGQGGFSLTASVRDLEFSDGEREPFLALAGLVVEEIARDSQADRLRVKAVEARGGRLRLARDGEGSLAALGLRFPRAGDGSSGRAVAAPAAASGAGGGPAEKAPALSLPRLELGRLLLEDHQIRFRDAAVEPENEITLADARLELVNLVIGASEKAGGGTAGDTARPDSPAADVPSVGAAAGLTASLTAPGVLDRFSVEGTVRAEQNSGTIDLWVRSEGITLERVVPYLREMGCEPGFVRGSLRCHVQASADASPEGVCARGAIRDVVFSEEGGTLAALGAVRVDGAVLEPAVVRIAGVEVQGPIVQVTKAADGALAVGGFRRCQAADELPLRRTEVASAPEVALAPSAPAFAVEIGRVLVTGAETRFTDRTQEPPLEVLGRTEIEVSNLVVGRPGPPIGLNVVISVPGAVDRFSIVGSASLVPLQEAISLDVAADGLRPGPFAVYLPPGEAEALSAGRFQAHVALAAEPHAQGGRRVELAVQDVEFRSGDGPPPLAVKEFAVRAGRLDPAAGVVELDEILTVGVTGELQRTEGGLLRVFGVPLPGGSPAEDASPAPAGAKDRTARPDGIRPGRLPLITVNRLDLQLERLAWIDRATAGAEPLVLCGVRLGNDERIELLGEDPEEHRPIRLRLTGSAQPVVGAFCLAVEASPFAPEPLAKAVVDVTGIQGDGLTRVLPPLAARLDASGLDDGRLAARVEALLRFRRRHSLDFDLGSSFGLDLDIADFAVRNGGADGAVLAGVDNVHVDVRGVDLATGSMHISRATILNPRGGVWRDDRGLHILGMAIKPVTNAAGSGAPGLLPEPASGAPSVGPGDGRAHTDEPALASTASDGPGSMSQATGVVKIDRLVVSGVDFTLRDETVSPPLIVPLTDLEAEARGLGTHLFAEPAAVLFRIRVGTGEVSLPRRQTTSALAGALLDAGRVIAGQQIKAPEVENRPLAQEIDVRGELRFSPRLEGWVRTGISMLELGAFKGPAAQAGITLDDGILDANLSLVFKEDGAMNTDAGLVFTDLSLSEPPNGPIVRHLRLPAPLGTVLFVLRDASGAIHVPLSFAVRPDRGVSATAITQQAVTLLGRMIADAIAASPFRLMGSVTDLAGITGRAGGDEAGPPVTLAFTAGAIAPFGPERAKIEELVDRMKRDPQIVVTLGAELGSEDVELAGVRANPPLEDTLALLARTRERKAALIAEREAMLPQALAARAARMEKESDAIVGQLRAFDRELGLIEDLLDRIGELLRPGAERYQQRRAREAVLAIGSARLLEVRRLLIGAGGPDFAPRVQLSTPRVSGDPSEPRGLVVARPILRRVP
ncbi:MAG: DUF748 domain-containing protein [Planctomycetes bacterium]|nr:DUF748 domain-containing protein [Planctomycetota bacterium]